MSRGKEFSFGKNWETFIRLNFSEERVEITKRHLLDFIGEDDLKDKYFLDIGSGSGIHSLAAYKANAKKIISIDVDPYSVETTKKIRGMHGNPPNWEVLHGSILDSNFISQIKAADIVYSWGVLHHTGNLWQAVRNAASLINAGGLFYIAIYVKDKDTDYWIAIKKKYNRSPLIIKKLMELGYVWRTFLRTTSLTQIKTSISYMRNYKKSRGMEFWTDVRDWLGGWPYEPATMEEMSQFCEKDLKLKMIKVKTGEANIEYLFEKKGS